jgi:hypothetical protein
VIHFLFFTPYKYEITAVTAEVLLESYIYQGFQPPQIAFFYCGVTAVTAEVTAENSCYFMIDKF